MLAEPRARGVERLATGATDTAAAVLACAVVVAAAIVMMASTPSAMMTAMMAAKQPIKNTHLYSPIIACRAEKRCTARRLKTPA